MHKTRSRCGQIALEHAFIRKTIGLVIQELDDLRRRRHLSSPETDWRLPGLVRELRHHLRRHFQFEEAGGLLGSAVEYYDSDTRLRIDELIAEHRAFECRLDRLMDDLELAGCPTPTVQMCFDRDFRRLVRDLQLHERAENGLLERLVSPGDLPPATGSRAKDPQRQSVIPSP